MQYLLLGIPVFIVGVIAANYWGPDAFGWVFIGVIGAVAAAWALGMSWATMHGWRKGAGSKSAASLKPHLFIIAGVAVWLSGSEVGWAIVENAHFVFRTLAFVAALALVWQLYMRHAYAWMAPVGALAVLFHPFPFFWLAFSTYPTIALVGGIAWPALYFGYRKWAAQQSGAQDLALSKEEIAE